MRERLECQSNRIEVVVSSHKTSARHSNGRVLERQVADLYRSMGARKVEHDVLLEGHQIDVYVEIELDYGSIHRIAVEAKDWRSPVGKDVVSKFVFTTDILRRAGVIDEGIVISSQGFTKSAREAASEHSRRGPQVRLLELADLQASVGVVPLVGIITAGKRIPVPDSKFCAMDYETITLPHKGDYNLQDLKGVYALRVRGKSMIDALVDDGDLIVVRPQQQVLPHEMAVIWLRENEDDEDGGTTLKHFRYEPDGRVRLQPANKAMSPEFVESDLVEIQGKVVMVIRQI